MILELITNGESAPAWRANLGSAEPLLQAINSTNKEVIKAVIDQFAAQIEREAIPYFVPANNELLALPAILP